MSRELRICPGVGNRKCGAFLSTLDRDPHPTCTRCRGKVCTKDMTCDICAYWSAAQWEQFVKKRSYKERKKPSRPSGSVPPALLASPRTETPSGVSHPGTSSSSFSRPSGGQDKRGLPPLPLDLGTARGVGVSLDFCLLRASVLPPLQLLRECLWTFVCCARARSLLFSSFDSWRGWSCSVTADFPCPLRFVGCLSLFLAARSMTWGTGRGFGGPLPLVILPWFPIFGSRSTEG